jgi:SAM-dependent methyltransferase
VELLRLREMESLLSLASELKSRRGNLMILEIGAGAGWQAKKMAEAGHTVEAIDIQDSNFLGHRVWPIMNYDGRHIPFPNDSFDIVFSSNVLSLIPHLEEFHAEMQRVLKPDGVAVHIVPSGSWRFWTNVTHYAFVFKALMKALGARSWSVSPASKDESCNPTKSRMGVFRRAIFPCRQGETGTALSEIYHFSRRGWESIFSRGGWVIKQIAPTRLFYTGYLIFGSKFSVHLRHLLSRVLGSACHVFVLNRRAMDRNDQEEKKGAKGRAGSVVIVFFHDLYFFVADSCASMLCVPICNCIHG